MKVKKYPITGYVAIWPTNQVIKVRIDKLGRSQWWPYQIVALEEKFEFGISGTNKICSLADPKTSFKIYPSRQKAEKSVLEKLHKQYREARKARREAEQKEKWANRQVFEYKNFGKLMSPFLKA